MVAAFFCILVIDKILLFIDWPSYMLYFLSAVPFVYVAIVIGTLKIKSNNLYLATAKLTRWHVLMVTTWINHTFCSEGDFSLFVWANYRPLVNQRTKAKTDQIIWMCKLVWVFTICTCHMAGFYIARGLVYSLHAGYCCMLFCRLVDFFLKINFFKKSFRNTISVEQFRSRSVPKFCQAWSGSKLFAKVISRRQKLPLAGKCEVGIFDVISGIYIWYFWYIYTFYYFFMKTCCGYSLEVPWEALLMSIHSIGFYGGTEKIISEVSSNTPPSQALWYGPDCFSFSLRKCTLQLVDLVKTQISLCICAIFWHS